MHKKLKVLFVEDSLEDFELELRELREAGFSPEARRVATLEGVLEELGSFEPQLVISDYRMPGFSGLEALAACHSNSPSVPFIFVSGNIGEERAIEALKNGATDYVIKDRMSRLVPCVTRALKEVEERAEREKLQKQLLQSQKMEAIGRLAGGIAHDFNNILTAILGYSHFLLDDLSEKDPSRQDIEEIKKAGERAASLTRQLLSFSRQQAFAPKDLDLNDLIRNFGSMLKRLVSEDVEIGTVLGDGVGRIKADPVQIEQVLLNLVVNARDAMPQGGKITIETADVELKEDFLRTHPEAHAGPYTMLAVSDTGSGMDADTLSHAFEPFFTTKEEGRGTGLGLAIVYGVVKQSGGSILVQSEPGHGSVFKIFLPRA